MCYNVKIMFQRCSNSYSNLYFSMLFSVKIIQTRRVSEKRTAVSAPNPHCPQGHDKFQIFRG